MNRAVTMQLINAFVFDALIEQFLFFLYRIFHASFVQPGLYLALLEAPKTGFLAMRLK